MQSFEFTLICADQFRSNDHVESDQVIISSRFPFIRSVPLATHCSLKIAGNEFANVEGNIVLAEGRNHNAAQLGRIPTVQAQGSGTPVEGEGRGKTGAEAELKGVEAEEEEQMR